MQRIKHKDYYKSNASIIEQYRASRDIGYLRENLSELKELEEIIKASENVSLQEVSDKSKGNFVSVLYILDYLLDYNENNIKKSLIKEGFEESIVFRAPNYKMTCLDNDNGLKYYNISYVAKNGVNIGIRFYEQKKEEVVEQK